MYTYNVYLLKHFNLSHLNLYIYISLLDRKFPKNTNKRDIAYSEVEVNDTHYTMKEESNLQTKTCVLQCNKYRLLSLFPSVC